MRNFISILLIGLCVVAMSGVAWGQKILTWQSTSSTAWATAANWYDEGAAGTSSTAPTSADAVTINSSRGASVNPSVSTATQAAKSLTVGSGFIVSIDGATGALAVGDGLTSNNDITIQSGGEIDHNSTAGAGNPFALSSTANDKFRIDNGGKYVHNTGRSYATPFPAGVCDFDVNSTVEFTQASGTALTASGRTYGNLIISATAAKTYTTAGAGAFIVNGTLTLPSANVTFSPNFSATEVTTINNLIVTSGTFSPGNTNAWSITFTGDITNNGTVTLPSTNVSVIFNGTTTISGSGAITFANGFTVNSTKTVTCNTGPTLSTGKTGTVNGTLATGATFTNNGIATINGTFQINEGGSASGTAFVYGGSGTLVYNGTSAQTTTSIEFPSSSGPANLSINNSAGVTLHASRTLSGTLTLTSGVLNTNGNILTISNTAPGAVDIPSTSGSITGTIQRSIPADPAADQIYKFTNTNTYIVPANIVQVAATVTMTSFPGTFPVPAANTTHAVQRYYTITPVPSDFTAATLRLEYLDPAETGNITDEGTLKLFRNNTITLNWDEVSSAADETGNFVTSIATPISNWSSWGIAQSGSPLPIQLSSFTGTLIHNRVKLDWATISEVNNYGFYTQKRSVGVMEWMDVSNSFVAGHGTTNQPHQYTFTDNGAFTGATQYRLKQVDLDGSIHFTEPIQVESPTSVKELAPIEFALKQNYPNPFNPETNIKFSVETAGRATLQLYNMLGQKVATLFDGEVEAGFYQTVRLNGSDLASGMYLYRLQSGKKTELKKLLLLK